MGGLRSRQSRCDEVLRVHIFAWRGCSDVTDRNYGDGPKRHSASDYFSNNTYRHNASHDHQRRYSQSCRRRTELPRKKHSGAPISQISPRDVSPRRHGPPQETIWAGGLQFEPTWRPRFSHKHSISEKLSICLWNKEIQSRDTDASHQTALVISVPSVHTVS